MSDDARAKFLAALAALKPDLVWLLEDVEHQRRRLGMMEVQEIEFDYARVREGLDGLEASVRDVLESLALAEQQL